MSAREAIELPYLSGPRQFGDVADRGGPGLDLPSFGAQSCALGFEVGQGRGLPTLASEHLAGLALAVNRGECRIGGTGLGRLGDGRIDFAAPAIEIKPTPPPDFEASRKGCVLRLTGSVCLLATSRRAIERIAPDRLKREISSQRLSGDTGGVGITGIAYTVQFGGGLSASVSLEDSGWGTGGRGRSIINLAGGGTPIAPSDVTSTFGLGTMWPDNRANSSSIRFQPPPRSELGVCRRLVRAP